MNSNFLHALPPTPDAAARIIAHVAEADLGYFRRHPERWWRLRLYIPGETPVPPPCAIAGVLVVRCHLGALRVYLPDFGAEEAAA